MKALAVILLAVGLAVMLRQGMANARMLREQSIALRDMQRQVERMESEEGRRLADLNKQWKSELGQVNRHREITEAKQVREIVATVDLQVEEMRRLIHEMDERPVFWGPPPPGYMGIANYDGESGEGGPQGKAWYISRNGGSCRKIWIRKPDGSTQRVTTTKPFGAVLNEIKEPRQIVEEGAR